MATTTLYTCDRCGMRVHGGFHATGHTRVSIGNMCIWMDDDAVDLCHECVEDIQSAISDVMVDTLRHKDAA